LNRLREPLERVLDRTPPTWRPAVDAWRASSAGRSLLAFVAARQCAGATVYPAQVLRAMELTPRDAVRVVILGQDPYHACGQAEGLAFSVPPGQRAPPSLRNVFRELQRDLGLPAPAGGHLGSWASQGVLLLNRCLTVEEGRPAAHADQGWEALTDSLIQCLAEDEVPKVFLLWGRHAQSLAPVIAARPGHALLQSNHPSPLSATRDPRPFLGNGHFSAANRYLAAQGRAPIDWQPV
jgi:uracil-DNA glycosylase